VVRSRTAREKAQLIAGAALETKAKDIVIMDMRRLSDICDYFVIASGDSTTHLKAVADNMEKSAALKGVRLWHREGRAEALWILLDYGDVVAHVFHSQTRGFYNLEKLWHDAPRIAFPAKGRRGAKKGKRRRAGAKKATAARKRKAR